MMKRILTTCLLAASTAVCANAHPGLPGHTHSPDEWPFPDVEWSMLAVASAAVFIAVYFALRLKRR